MIFISEWGITALKYPENYNRIQLSTINPFCRGHDSPGSAPQKPLTDRKHCYKMRAYLLTI